MVDEILKKKTRRRSNVPAILIIQLLECFRKFCAQKSKLINSNKRTYLLLSYTEKRRAKIETHNQQPLLILSHYPVIMHTSSY